MHLYQIHLEVFQFTRIAITSLNESIWDIYIPSGFLVNTNQSFLIFKVFEVFNSKFLNF